MEEDGSSKKCDFVVQPNESARSGRRNVTGEKELERQIAVKREASWDASHVEGQPSQGPMKKPTTSSQISGGSSSSSSNNTGGGSRTAPVRERPMVKRSSPGATIHPAAGRVSKVRGKGNPNLSGFIKPFRAKVPPSRNATKRATTQAADHEYSKRRCALIDEDKGGKVGTIVRVGAERVRKGEWTPTATVDCDDGTEGVLRGHGSIKSAMAIHDAIAKHFDGRGRLALVKIGGDGFDEKVPGVENVTEMVTIPYNKRTSAGCWVFCQSVPQTKLVLHARLEDSGDVGAEAGDGDGGGAAAGPCAGNGINQGDDSGAGNDPVASDDPGVGDLDDTRNDSDEGGDSSAGVDIKSK